MKFLLFAGALLAFILVLAFIADRRGKRHGHVNPPRDYYDGNPMIHAAREVDSPHTTGGAMGGGGV
ncbi:hypothetical protein [Catellatospora vulcania]|uniref:hypothetical protein n=1 Tax=Catellatospora vulcania TaxID=1460450 RepID=UPI0012D3E521|nr:hypothetical protein [Catellatospora vulcania]